MHETRAAVLDALSSGPVTGPDLAERLGVSRAAVWKHVEALREAGFEIESREDGYVLVGIPEFGGEAVEYGLDAPFEVEFHETIGSTNDRARELAGEGAEDVVVLADEQTGGRGRLDREWSSPSGGVWASLVLRPSLPPARVSLLTLAAAVAVTDAAREAGVAAAIKWPNDVLVSDREESNEPSSARSADDSAERGGRKLAGILTEMEGESNRVSWVVLGVGVNANVPAEALHEGATSLQDEFGAVDRRRFVQRVLERFDELRESPDDVVPAWKERSATLGQRVRVETPGGAVVGEAVDVTDVGALVVQTDTGGREVVHAGDCEHLRPV
ncbi:biotin--[acetyl-CoA-carboxylase] ligase [Halospeciosus flavus]|uniref:Biotin--[acetyl-CoA-carboxylase] ligase n=2 Tax=Halospeciosus flavus TaxID=3032283 RepID=A0ABD5Z1S6_9EURY|nr:biotin--[acetyl-CoA-carboxylase] ligase [Halospeciosus flavus]